MSADERRALRLLRRIARPGGAGPGGSHDPGLVADLLRRGLVANENGRLTLTRLGVAHLRRHLAGADGFAHQHQTRLPALVDDEALGRIRVTMNEDESPLARLRRTRGRDGAPLIGPAAFAAGERLRADFTRGRIMPRVTANWSAAVAAGRRDGGAGGMAELTDQVIAARQRVAMALDAVGPDFAGLLVDVCCFLKGIEAIERERQWPARSAKLVLRLALDSLARHYGLSEEGRGPGRAQLRHWGAEDYRPRINPEPRR
jgi:hypothetical protein